MRNIKIDFVAVESQARQLEEIAEGIRRLAERKMTGTIESMAAIPYPQSVLGNSAGVNQRPRRSNRQRCPA